MQVHINVDFECEGPKLLEEGRSTSAMLEEREEIEEKLEEKDLNKGVALNHAIATLQQGHSTCSKK